MKLRAAVIPATKIGSMISIPLFFIGLIMASEYLMTAGIILYSTIALFQLITLPVEFNASKRALRSLEATGILRGDDLTAAKKVLSAAALTYVAALATSLMTLLRLVLLASGGSRRRR
jgi:Zn-dependent membrane protease YugP